jgi:hypothetical protein
MKLVLMSSVVRPDHWKQFKAAAPARGLCASAQLRQLIVEFLRREAREMKAIDRQS